MKIYIDSREDKERINMFKGYTFFSDAEVKNLDIGDIVAIDGDKKIAIEVKTLQDWIASCNNNQLRKEAYQMQDCPLRAIIVYDDDKLNTRYTRLPTPGRNYDIMAECAFRWHVPVFFCDNEIKFVYCVMDIIKHISKEFDPLPKPIVVKKHTDDMVAVLINLPHIGVVTAEKLLDIFGTPGGVFNATDDELKNIKGISKKQIKIIQRMR